MFTIKTDGEDYVIDLGSIPPRLIDPDTGAGWIIVTKPQPESFSEISKKWYQRHPKVPEAERRLLAWLEDRLIDWLPLASSRAHFAVKMVICKALCGCKKLNPQKVSVQKPLLAFTLNFIMASFEIKPNCTLQLSNSDTTLQFKPEGLKLVAENPFIKDLDPNVMKLWTLVVTKKAVIASSIKGKGSQCTFDGQTVSLSNLIEKLAPSITTTITTTTTTTTPTKKTSTAKKIGKPDPKVQLTADDFKRGNWTAQVKFREIEEAGWSKSSIQEISWNNNCIEVGKSVSMGYYRDFWGNGEYHRDCHLVKITKFLELVPTIAEKVVATPNKETTTATSKASTKKADPKLQLTEKDFEQGNWKALVKFHGAEADPSDWSEPTLTEISWAKYDRIKFESDGGDGGIYLLNGDGKYHGISNKQNLIVIVQFLEQISCVKAETHNVVQLEEEDPKKLADLVDKVQDSEELPTVYLTRITETMLPGTAMVQIGEIFGTEIKWLKPQESDLEWSAQCNLDNEPGIILDCGGWGYAGFEPTQGIYIRYDDVLPGQEHCFRVLNEPKLKSVPQSIDPVDSQVVTSEDCINTLLEQVDNVPDDAEAGDDNDSDSSEITIADDTNDFIIQMLEQQFKVDPAKTNEFITQLYQSFVETTPSPIPQNTPHKVLNIYTRDNREKEDPPITLCSATFDELAIMYGEYLRKNRDVEDYMEDEEFDEMVMKLTADMRNGIIEDWPNLNSAFIVMYSGSEESEKLKSTQSTSDKDTLSVVSISEDMPKNATNQNDTISMTEVATMLCELGIEIADHFDLDVDETVEFIDGLCEDKIGKCPNAAETLSKVKELADDGDDGPSLDDVEQWFLATNKGGLKATDLKAKADEFGLDIAGKNKKEQKELFVEYVNSLENDEDDEDVEEDDGDGDEDDAGEEAEPSLDDVDQWFLAANKGGLKAVDLKAKADEFGLDIAGKNKKEQKELFVEYVNSLADNGDDGEDGNDEDENDDGEDDENDDGEDDDNDDGEDDNDDDEDGQEGPSLDDVDQWFLAPAKGGLKAAELKAKADEFGLDIAGKSKKEQKELFVEYVNSLADGGDDGEDNDGDGSDGPSLDDVDKWFLAANKGGLKAAELKAKADELGLDIAGKNKKEQKELLVEYVNSLADSGDDGDDGDDDTEQTVVETCQFVYTKGSQKGENCSTKPKDGATFCGKHKDCKKASTETAGKEDTTKSAPPKIKSASTGQCLYVTTRGNKPGVQCNIKPKPGDEFCAKHANSQAAADHKAKKTTSSKLKFVKNKKANVWVVDGENLVIKSPENPKVYAFLTKSGQVNKTLSPALKLLADELGLKVEA